MKFAILFKTKLFIKRYKSHNLKKKWKIDKLFKKLKKNYHIWEKSLFELMGKKNLTYFTEVEKKINQLSNLSKLIYNIPQQ